MSAVTLETVGPVTTLTLNRAETRNAMGPGMILELTQLFGALSMDESRVIVLTGSGEAFSAGADVNWMRKSRDLTDDQNIADAGTARAMWEAIDSCAKPVIARVNGHALGGGSGLVACCDVAVSVESALFGFTEARLGLIPATISPYVLRKIGPGHARSLFVTGRRFGADEALRLGLIHRVTTADDLDAAVAELADELLQCSPVAIAETKRMLRDATAQFDLPDLPLRLAAVRAAPEAQEGLTAFLEKTQPGWVVRSGE